MQTPPMLIIHLIPALAATALGGYLLTQSKGTLRHKRLGVLWAALMLATAITSFGMTGGRLAIWNGFSVIHALSAVTLVLIPAGFWAAWQRRARLHRNIMGGLYIALCITGILAILMRGRFLNTLLL